MRTRNRKSTRLRDYDYAQPGAYFVTLCVQNRECLFGKIVDGKMELNGAGNMIEKWCMKLPDKYSDIKCDDHIVMPNHFHAIIAIVPTPTVGADPRVYPNSKRGLIVGADLCVRPVLKMESTETGGRMERGNHMGLPRHSAQRRDKRNRTDIPAVVQWFKTMTTDEYIRNVKKNGWPSFSGRLWQRNYYDHIIRDEKSLFQIRRYIRNNPLNWDSDEENPFGTSPRYVAMPDPQKGNGFKNGRVDPAWRMVS